MLTSYPTSPSGAPPPWWIDLLDPTEEERAAAEAVAGLRLPTRAELVEIESSSRANRESLCTSTRSKYFESIAIARLS